MAEFKYVIFGREMIRTGWVFRTKREARHAIGPLYGIQVGRWAMRRTHRGVRVYLDAKTNLSTGRAIHG